MKVIKRDGKAVDYNREKIQIAIEKANNEVKPKERITKTEIREITKYIEELDKKRIQGLFENIKENQVIITCTDSFKINNSKYKLFKVTNATIDCI